MRRKYTKNPIISDLTSKSLILYLFLIAFQPNGLRAQEAVLINETIDWKWQMPQWYGGNAFYWWHREDVNPDIINFGEMSSTNWTSPYDYRGGTFYLRFIVLDQPTASDFSLQFGIWQDINRAGGWLETCSALSYLSGGAGSSIQKSIGSPANWWQIRTEEDVDFTRPEDFYRIGILLWKGSGSCIPYGQTWSASSSQCANPTTESAKYFPMTARLTVVAVAKGHTFSGWSNYPTGGSTKPPTPTYAVDYTNEVTSKVVPSTDEYAYSSNMSGAVSGTGIKLALTPGRDVYFRTKAAGNLPASNIQTLDVPSRPAAPTFAYDATNQRTSTTVSSAYEYSDSETMSPATTGTGTYVSFAAGKTKYFRKKATTSAFKSSIQSLLGTTAPSTAPNYKIDYSNERTSVVVAATDEYSLNQTTWTSGSGNYLTLTPGNNVYFRKKATPAAIQTLVVPARPATPTFAYDAANQRTSTTVSSAYEYSDSQTMSPATTGSGTYVSFASGTTKYFRKKATTTAFKSNVQSLTGTSSPSTPPNYQIDYANLRTSAVVVSTDEYSYNQTDWTSGAGSYLTLTPGKNVYFRKKATPAGVQTLIVPARPAAPVFAIDFITEKTKTTVSSAYKYSINANMSSATTGNGQTVALSPGTTLYFRKSSTSSAFASEIQTLNIPARPATPTFAYDAANQRTSTTVSSAYEYSESQTMSPATTGTGTYVSFPSGTTRYFRKKATTTAFKSIVQSLTGTSVPSTPPTYKIDYSNLRTSTVVASTDEYSYNKTDWTSGAGSYLTLTPGKNVYFRKKATPAGVQTLIVPARPAAPLFAINYVTEKTKTTVAAEYQYSVNANMSSATTGSGLTVALSPGTKLYFRKSSTSSSFASEIQTLNIPARPASPQIGINYELEVTDAISSAYVYSTKADMSGSKAGIGSTLPLTPGTSLYIQRTATEATFKSSVQHLVGPARPVLKVALPNPVTTATVPVDIHFPSAVTGFTAADILVVNGKVDSLKGKYTAYIKPLAKGEVEISLPANVVNEGNFAALTVSFDYQVPTSLDPDNQQKFSVYPTYVTDFIRLVFTGSITSFKYEIIDSRGVPVLNGIITENDTRISVTQLPPGVYLIRFDSELTNGQAIKFIKN